MTELDDLPQFSSLDISGPWDGWGPVGIPESFKDMPYQPFTKEIRLGKVADWSGAVYNDNKMKNRYTSHFGGAQYTYYHNEDDSNFQMVSGTKDQKNMMRYRYRPPNYRNRRGVYPGAMGMASRKLMPGGRPMTEREAQLIAQQGGMTGNAGGQTRRWGGQGGGGGGTGAQPVNWARGGVRGGYNRGRGNYGNYGSGSGRLPSVPVLDSWDVLEEMDFARLAKLSLPSVNEPTDLVQCGEMEYYDKNYDKVNTKNEAPLTRHNRVVHQVKAGQDPVFARLARQKAGNVYMTDASAAAIMCCTRSMYSWDLLVVKEAGCLFFDRRGSGDPSSVDQRCHLLTVCETAAEPPAEEPATSINSAGKLALEATYINANFTQQVLDSNGKKYHMPEKNPFRSEDDEEEGELHSVGYRYRQFELGNNIRVVMRCEVDGVLPGTGTKKKPAQFTYIRALNEFDSKAYGSVDWRTKMDCQRGAVLASELKNNAYKLAKWTICAILASADVFHLGFVSRVNPKNSGNHSILGILPYKPEEFGQQINLNMDNAWGILRCVIDTFMKLPDGKYLFMKDPNKPQLRIYGLPRDAFEDSDVEDSSEDESDDNDEDDDEEDEEEKPTEVEDASVGKNSSKDNDAASGEEKSKMTENKKASPNAADSGKNINQQRGTENSTKTPAEVKNESAQNNAPTPVLQSTGDGGQTFKAKRKAKK